MTALLLTLAAFGVWTAIGLAVLAGVHADVHDLRVALTAPLLGTSATMVLLFPFSEAGVGVRTIARPAVASMLLAALAVLAVRRPRLPAAAAPVLCLCVLYAILIGRPLFTYGFHWLSNANEDMANYVLSATKLLDHGLLAQMDVIGLAHDRDYPTALQGLHSAGTRPGSDLTLAALSAISGKPAYAVFMPLILAFGLCAICGAAALAMQGTNSPWAASLAAALLVASPLQAYGLLQELLPQVWALGLAAALFALLMRPELHGSPGPRARDVVPIVLLTVTIFVSYIELASTLLAGYLLYLVVLLVKRKVRLRSILVLWGLPVAGALLVLNGYLFRELHFITGQAGNGLRPNPGALFSYTLLPSTLPGILGLQVLPAHPTTPHLNASILAAIILFALITGACLLTLSRGVAGTVMLLTDLALGVTLASRSSDFGLFKLYMYIQPFLAAAVAVWISLISPRVIRIAALVLAAAVVVVQLRIENDYVLQSRNPVDLRHASSADVLPAFRRAFEGTSRPFVIATDIPFLIKIIGSTTGERPTHFSSTDYFERLVESSTITEDKRYVKIAGWRKRRFALGPTGPTVTFSENVRASKTLRSGSCTIVTQSGSQLPFNRRLLPEGSPDLLIRTCGAVDNLLAFVPSSLGQSPYLFSKRRRVAVYQLEPDYFFHGHSFAGLGRYVLFRVLSPSVPFRLELDVTTTVRQDGSNSLPPATAVGGERVALDLVGRGSARVFSPVLRPRVIDGQAYVLLDMGAEGFSIPTPRPGLQGLYGRNIDPDPRVLTSYVRDISLLTPREYDARRPPLMMRTFPAALANRDLEYSGIFEDGWVGEDSYLVLGGGRATRFRLRADMPVEGGNRLEVAIDGRPIVSRTVPRGQVDVAVPVPSSAGPRRVTLRWSRTEQLTGGDHRRVAARLEGVGFG